MDGDGEGDAAVEPRGQGAAGIDVPSVLAQLDDAASTEQRAAVRRIRTAIDEQGRTAAYVPTVPKLRALLERPDIDFRVAVAACLADLAAEAPTDVAPSTATIVDVAVERADEPVTQELLRCLAAVADERPTVVADHVPAIADVLERRSGYDRRGLRVLAHVSRAEPTAVEPAVDVLTGALAADPVENGRPTLRALGRLARSDASLPALGFVTHVAALVDHDDSSLRRDAIGCLDDVARRDPAAVEPICADLGPALSSPDPDTRAVAAITVARVATETDAAVEPVRDQLLELLADDQPRVRANACIALGNGRVAAAAPRLATLAYEDPAPNVRDRASWAAERLSARQ
ncbi:HEAT repeat domain-containing protein [Natrinema salaciae]|uniref:HEAT repeat-containing protein n=1 Tax=Natrinema salaciae TaxID=1186196 RepID=A0A1H9FH58_9EURY|nr:HEAT repeat domain-containing protein [Natrinema salaciae]SEQ37266.1 HEAT repeat-containing protein [Natrinema salaciae]